MIVYTFAILHIVSFCCIALSMLSPPLRSNTSCLPSDVKFAGGISHMSFCFRLLQTKHAGLGLLDSIGRRRLLPLHIRSMCRAM